MDEATGERRPEVGEAGEGGQGQRSPEEIRQDIDKTRGELGDTVEALAGKADVKGQAKHKVDEAKQTAQQKVDEAKQAAQRKVEEAKQAAQQKREEFAGKAEAASPESATAGAHQVANLARQNPVPLAIAGVLIVGFLLGRRRRSRR